MWPGLVMNKKSWQTYIKPTFISNYFLSGFSSDALVFDDLCSCEILLSSLENLNVDTSSTTPKNTMNFISFDFVDYSFKSQII